MFIPKLLPVPCVVMVLFIMLSFSEVSRRMPILATVPLVVIMLFVSVLFELVWMYVP